MESSGKPGRKETRHDLPPHACPVELIPGFVDSFWSPQEAEDAFHDFLASLDWRQDTLVLFGRHVLQPRLVAFHADDGVAYAYSGHALPRAPWTPRLAILKAHVEAWCGVSFNSVLCNLYRDGNDSMGWHSDDERSLGPAPLIASVSLGAVRAFHLRRKEAHEGRLRLELPSGSLLVMKDDCQTAWQHAVPKTKKSVGMRLNFTFRRVFGERQTKGT